MTLHTLSRGMENSGGNTGENTGKRRTFVQGYRRTYYERVEGRRGGKAAF